MSRAYYIAKRSPVGSWPQDLSFWFMVPDFLLSATDATVAAWFKTSASDGYHVVGVTIPLGKPPPDFWYDYLAPTAPTDREWYGK